MSLYDAFSAAAEAEESKTALKKEKAQVDLFYRIVQLQLTLRLAELGYDKKKELRRLTGFDNIKAARSVFTMWVEQHNSSVKEKEEQHKSVNHTQRISEQLLELSSYQGYELHEKRTSVLQLALTIKRYRREVKAQQEQLEKLKLT